MRIKKKKILLLKLTYKDTVLRKLLSENKRAIEVANAVQDKEKFSDDEKVIPLNLKDTLSDRYNDIAFTVGDVLMVILEHQSSIKANMALRILIYYAKILNAYYINMKKLYSSKIYKLPVPIFYVLYNGEEPLKEDIICLSDDFDINHEFSIELKVKVIDINSDSSHEILEKSPSLKGYAHLISLIRSFIEKGYSRDNSIKKAI